MTVREQIERLDRLIEFLENELPTFSEQVLAADLVALITNRVVQKGEDHTGSKFKAYSTKQVAAFRFLGKGRNKGADAKVKKIIKSKGGLSYAGFRQLNNLNTNVKNFEFTGSMWRKFGVVKKTEAFNVFVISMGGTTGDSQDKIDSNSNREGISIIEASFIEQDIVRDTAGEWLEETIKRILNG